MRVLLADGLHGLSLLLWWLFLLLIVAAAVPRSRRALLRRLSTLRRASASAGSERQTLIREALARSVVIHPFERRDGAEATKANTSSSEGATPRSQ